jgi:pimeloyl-ACP methyl ester carboxylesterase
MASDYDAAGARCGTLVVAESRDRGAGRPRELRIAVAVLPPTGDAPAPDPVVFLHGGPGGSALRFGARWLTHPLRERRALILLDERGSGESRPLLCPELQLEDFRILAQNLRPAEEGAARVEVALACRDALVADGFDLGAWNSDAIADDVEDLRKALGYESWNVFGLSYGTKLALTLLRRHPEGIRSVVLDSVYPPNVAGWDARVASFDRALDALGQACAEQEACAEAFPDLRADLLAALARLDERPIIGSTGNEELLPSGRFVVNASDYAITVHQLLYDHRNLPIVPLYLREFRADPDTLAMPLADATTARAVGLARAVALAVGCYERAPFASPEGRARLGEAHSELLAHFVYFLPDYAICDEWSEAQAGPRESRAVESDVPALVLAGEIDPITPPAWAFTTVESLSNGRPFVFPGVGHGVDRSSACARGLVAAFLDDPAAELDATCIDETPPIAFVTDYHRSPGIYGLVQSLLVDRGHAAVLGFGGMLALLLSGAVGWLLVGAWRVASGGTSPPWHRAHVWIGSAAAVALLLWGAVFAAVVEVADAGGLLLLLGLPAWMGPVSLLRWVALGLAAVGLDALVRGRQDMTTARFLHGLAVGVAAALAAALPGLLGLA